MKLPLTLAAAAIVSTAFAAPQRGHLVLIGGGDKPPEAMAKFVELAGGPQAPIVVVPTASEEADTGDYYIKLFKEEHGCSNVTVLPIKTREDAAREDLAALARTAGGIFFAGGDQSRITEALLDTPVGDAIEAAFEAGAAVGGTSAGTACQSALMITGEGDFTVIRSGAVELVRGLGLFRDVIVDQHFVARQRFNRLLSVTLEHPDMLGVGVDEDTAVWVQPDGIFQVMGRNCVLVIDAGDASVRRDATEDGPASLSAHDVRVHVLLAGERFDIGQRKVLPPRSVPRRRQQRVEGVQGVGKGAGDAGERDLSTRAQDGRRCSFG